MTTVVSCVLLLQDRLTDIAISETLQRAASVGGSTIKLIDVKGWKEVCPCTVFAGVFTQLS